MTAPVIAHGTSRGYRDAKGCSCDACRGWQSRRVAANRAKRLAELNANPDDPRHGSRNAYDCGCRCERCKAARSVTGRAAQAARRLSQGVLT